MTGHAVERAKVALKRHDAALDRWPARNGTGFAGELHAVVDELTAAVGEARVESAPVVDQARLLRWLGDAYFDLANGRDAEVLAKGKLAYEASEILLTGVDEPMEKAKLNFNFANTLRGLSAGFHLPVLLEAKRRYEEARAIFERKAPELVPQTNQILATLAPQIQLASAYGRLQGQKGLLDQAERSLRSGNREEAESKLHSFNEAMQELGVKIADGLSQANEQLPELQGRPEVDELLRALREGSTTSRESSESAMETMMLGMLRARFERDVAEGKVDRVRAASIGRLLDRLDAVFRGPADDVPSLQARTAALSELSRHWAHLMGEPSLGIPKPPPGSRAGRVRELWSTAMGAVFEEGMSGFGGSTSRDRAFELLERIAEDQKLIYEAGADDGEAYRVEREIFRPLAIEIRGYVQRDHWMLAWPIWSQEPATVDPNGVFYSGRSDVKPQLRALCESRGLDLLESTRGRAIAVSRWKLLQQANVCLFDLRGVDGPIKAQAAYEAGVARTLSKPSILLIEPGRRLPFDFDAEPVPVGEEPVLGQRLGDAIDATLYEWGRSGEPESLRPTLEKALEVGVRRKREAPIGPVLKLLEAQKNLPDGLDSKRALETLFRSLGTGEPLLIQSPWPPLYAAEPRLFHVTPFDMSSVGIDADQVASAVENACRRAGFRYVRGDTPTDPQILRSIWDEICRATHVLVDLTGFNANVAFELGIAHTLGRPTHLVGFEGVEEQLFPMIAHHRVYPYKKSARFGGVVKSIADFLSTN